MNVMSMQQHYPGSYGAQQPGSQEPFRMPQTQGQRPIQRTIKFYQSSLLWFNSAVGNFMRDHKKMEAQGWQVAHYAFLGTTAFFLRRVIAVTYERAIQ